MVSGLNIVGKELKLYTRSHIPAVLNAYMDGGKVDPLPYMAAACVFPMRANNYVIDELIDWNNVPDDPIFQLVFPQPGEKLRDPEKDLTCIRAYALRTFLFVCKESHSPTLVVWL